jgi:recombinational DNA repair ATPase RecF
MPVTSAPTHRRDPEKAQRLHGRILDRLNRETPARETWGTLVLGALEGAEALDSLLEQGPAPVPAKPAAAPQPKPAAAYLRSVTVEGFRGIGRGAQLDFPPGPGLTLVVGRNGSGKSSFAEALELLLTGNTFRWAQRTKVWREGWRNLHHVGAAITAEFVLEGEKAPATIARRWETGAALEAAETSVQVQGKPKKDLVSLGWTAPLVSYRPFLSYNELGSMLDEGPSRLYDALASILGLDDLVAAQERLGNARKAREKQHKEAADLRKQILATLEQVEDERAKALATALGREDWGLDDAERIATRDAGDGGADRELAVLKQVANLAYPDPAAVETVVRGLTDASKALKDTAGTLAGRSKELADILEHALRFHERHGDGPCPVCGRKAAMDAGWHSDQAAQVKRLREAARDATSAQQAAETARRRATELPIPRADVVRQAGEIGLDVVEVQVQLANWQTAVAVQDLDELATKVQGAAEPLRASVLALRGHAAAVVQRREDAWRPLALQIAAWLKGAREARKGSEAVRPLKAAEQWLKDAIGELRNEQFAPIKEKCQAIWTQLRQQSNVSLEDIRLAGTATSRKVELSVTVDGVEGAALGVMSQGELHALALSLFIPRATLPDSPFRFIVIDDPVQSMDPSRVDGLARVLETAAKDRQVVVFTHDDRLPEAVRRMGIGATVLEVYRRENSAVEVRKGRDPVARHIEDALAVAQTDGLPPAAAKRVIPGLCRLALEAACVEAVRRRRLGKGERNADVEDLLARCTKTNTFLAFALSDDPTATSAVMPRLNNESPAWADLVRVLNQGAHGVEGSARVGLVEDTKKLARWLQARP